MPGRFVDNKTAEKIMDAFFKATFEGGRHERRVQKNRPLEVNTSLRNKIKGGFHSGKPPFIMPNYFLFICPIAFVSRAITASNLIICHAYAPCKSPQTQHLQY